MAIKVSKALRNWMMTGGSFKAAMETEAAEGFKMVLYAGTVPANCEDAAGTAVVTITNAGDGVTSLAWAATATDGVLQKLAAGTGSDWQGTSGSGGTMTYFRFEKLSDTNAADGSNVKYRVQGTVAATGADLNVSNITLSAAQIQVINSFSLALPNP